MLSFLVELNCSLEHNTTTRSLLFSQCTFFLFKKNKFNFFPLCYSFVWTLLGPCRKIVLDLKTGILTPLSIGTTVFSTTVFSIFLLFPGFDLHLLHSRDLVLLSIQGLVICFKYYCQYTLLFKALK